MSQSPPYDAIVVGAGHNGLVAAATLAKAGRRVLVLERRPVLGGAAAGEALWPGFQVNTGAHDAGLFRPEIVAALELERHGLVFVESPAIATNLLPDGESLTLWREDQRTQSELARGSAADAARFPAFRAFLARTGAVLDDITLRTPPDPAAAGLLGLGWAQALPWLRTALKLKGLGDREMMEFIRVAPMSVADFLDEWFTAGDALKGLLGMWALAGSRQGPRAAGTAFTLFYHCLGGEGLPASRFVKGGMGQLSAALALAAQRQGATVRTAAAVRRIIVDQGRAIAVELATGEVIAASLILSSADPRHTLLDLIGAERLPVKVMRRVRNIRFRGSTAKVNLALSGLPRFPGLNADQLAGHLVVCPGTDYLERAHDDAKVGRVSAQPALDGLIPTVLDPTLAPPGQHLLSVTVRFPPYHLADGTWDAERKAALGRQVIRMLAQHAPDLPELVLHEQVLSPLDWEEVYGLSEGSIYQGQMGLDQLLFMRPIAGFGRYRSPIHGLYFCGAGAHPGGGVTGAPGYNAARQALRDD